MIQINMSEFGYSLFSEKTRISTGRQTFRIKGSAAKEKQGSFSISKMEQSQKENSNKLSSILIKFNAGKKLSAEEMAYLRNNHPETYTKVQQVMMEREALERRMRAAKTKEETAAVYMSAVSSAMPKGTGEAAAGGSSVSIAKLNQLSDAHRLYTASGEYKAKTDRADIAKEERARLEEMAETLEKQQAKLSESMEKQKLLTEELSASQVDEDDVFAEQEQKTEEAKDTLEEAERMKRSARRKRKKVHASRKKSGQGASASFHFNPLSETKMHEKLRELFRTQDSEKKTQGKTAETGLKNASTEAANSNTKAAAGIQSHTGFAGSNSAIGTTIDIAL